MACWLFGSWVTLISLRPSDDLRVGKLTSIASDSDLSPGRHQAIIWNNAGILLIGPLGTNFSDFFFKIQTFSLKKIHGIFFIG